jgi:hypothetical protein
MQHLHLHDLPQDVRDLLIEAVRALIERGPQGLVAAGLCVPGAVNTMAQYVSDYPGQLVDLPGSAELWAHVGPDGVWSIDLPLHNDREGRMDLFLFLDVDPAAHVVRVTDLYAP